jgi:hypothetical protein
MPLHFSLSSYFFSPSLCADASYYLLHESTVGADLPFSAKALAVTHNADLADTLVGLASTPLLPPFFV